MPFVRFLLYLLDSCLANKLVHRQRAEVVLTLLTSLLAGPASQQVPQQDTGMEAQAATGGLLSLLFAGSLGIAGPWRGARDLPFLGITARES